ncbi:hypothetical protein BQ8794_140066 [Mesorhizobium prunaredense]|uniref:Uncharacterized protein n=1 Tax=Mesorhizobium prunaredense TaxID=1631249 RepID=A0A1R3V210_9HYPH|nr:hypothetical protein BQ8794_140066 [Mesorhizobium prunaredense]
MSLEIFPIFRRQYQAFRTLGCGVDPCEKPFDAIGLQVDLLVVADKPVVPDALCQPNAIGGRIYPGQPFQLESGNERKAPLKTATVQREAEGAVTLESDETLPSRTTKIDTFVEADFFELTVFEFLKNEILVSGEKSYGLQDLLACDDWVRKGVNRIVDSDLKLAVAGMRGSQGNLVSHFLCSVAGDGGDRSTPNT